MYKVKTSHVRIASLFYLECISFLQADAQARRNQLMKDMAQLRLQAEVSQLEGALQSHDQPNLPPYLVPDAASLSGYLSQIKQLANSSRFIIIIPLAGKDTISVLL